LLPYFFILNTMSALIGKQQQLNKVQKGSSSKSAVKLPTPLAASAPAPSRAADASLKPAAAAPARRGQRMR